MSCLPLTLTTTPLLKLNLPARTITIPPNHLQDDYNTNTRYSYNSGANQTPAGLKIKIEATILVPTPLVSPRVIVGRKLEESLDVVVPIGGKVDVEVELKEGGLNPTGVNNEAGSSKGKALVEQVVCRVFEVFEKVSDYPV
jgi:hypothetical protein